MQPIRERSTIERAASISIKAKYPLVLETLKRRGWERAQNAVLRNKVSNEADLKNESAKVP